MLKIISKEQNIFQVRIEINSLLKDESKQIIYFILESTQELKNFEDIDIVMKSNNNSFFEVIKLAKAMQN